MIGQHTSEGTKVFVSFSAIDSAFAINGELIGQTGHLHSFKENGTDLIDNREVIIDFKNGQTETVPVGVVEVYNPIIYFMEFLVYKFFTQTFWLEQLHELEIWFRNLPFLKIFFVSLIAGLIFWGLLGLTRSDLEKLGLERAGLIESISNEEDIQANAQDVIKHSKEREKSFQKRIDQIEKEEKLLK